MVRKNDESVIKAKTLGADFAIVRLQGHNHSTISARMSQTGSQADLQIAQALAAYAQGDWPTGWRLFEARHDPDWARRYGWSQTKRNLTEFARPVSAEAPLLTDLLIVAEGGAGDTIQFARYLPLLRAKLPQARLVFEVQNQLLELIRQLPGMDGIEIIPRTAADGAIFPISSEIRHVLPLLSLPAWLGLALQDQIPPPPPFTRTHQPPKDGKLHIGFCWRTDPNNKLDPGRDVPLAALLPIINHPQIVATSLLDDMTPEEIGTAPRLRRFSAIAGRIPFTQMATIIQQQHLVIACDTAWPNLSATLGIPTLMLTLKEPNWRWGLSGESTPWYPAMTLLRQTQKGDWREPISRASAIIEGLLNPSA